MVEGFAMGLRSRIRLFMLGVLSGVSAFARWGIDILSPIASQFDLVLVVFTLVADHIEIIAALGAWITWAMYGYLLLIIAPRLYPELVRTLVSPVRFRALVAGFGLAVAMFLLYAVRLLVTGRPFHLLFLLFILTLLPILTTYYLASMTGRVDEVFGPFFDPPVYELDWDYRPPPNEVVLLVEATSEFQQLAESTDEDVKYDRSNRYEAMWEKAVYALTFPIAISGLLVAVLFLFSPAPELVLLAGIALLTLEDRLPHRYGSLARQVASGLTERNVDIGYRILANLGPMMRHEKSRSGLVLVISGAAMSTFLFWIGIRRLWPVELLAGFGTDGLWATWTAFALAGLFGFWYWLRTLLRLPAFGTCWESGWVGLVSTEATDSEGDDCRTIPVRPRGFLLPTASFAVVGAIGWQEPPWIGPRGVGLTWLVGMSLLLGTVWLTWQADPQAAASEWYAAPLGWVVQFAGTATVFVTVVSPTTSLLWVLLFAVLGPNIFYAIDIYRYADSRNGFRGRVHIAHTILGCWYWCGVLVSGLFLFSSVWYLELVCAWRIWDNWKIASVRYDTL